MKQKNKHRKKKKIRKNLEKHPPFISYPPFWPKKQAEPQKTVTSLDKIFHVPSIPPVCKTPPQNEPNLGEVTNIHSFYHPPQKPDEQRPVSTQRGSSATRSTGVCDQTDSRFPRRLLHDPSDPFPFPLVRPLLPNLDLRSTAVANR